MTGDGRLVYWVQSKRYWYTPWLTKGNTLKFNSPEEFSVRDQASKCITEMKRVEESNRVYFLRKKRKVLSYEEV